MADFPASSPAQKCHFSNGKRRKVIVKHEALLGLAFESFQALHVIAGSERGGHQGLGFAASEDSGTMSTRQHADFDPDVANLIKGPAVRTPLLLDYRLAENSFTQRLVVSLQLGLRLLVIFGNRSLQFLLQLPHQVVA